MVKKMVPANATFEWILDDMNRELDQPYRFGARLRQIRKDLGETQDEFAARIGTSKQVLSRYENGQRIPKISLLERYARSLGVSVDYLMGNTEEQEAAYKAFCVQDENPFYKIFLDVLDEMKMSKNEVSCLTGLSPWQVDIRGAFVVCRPALREVWMLVSERIEARKHATVGTVRTVRAAVYHVPDGGVELASTVGANPVRLVIRVREKALGVTVIVCGPHSGEIWVLVGEGIVSGQRTPDDAIGALSVTSNHISNRSVVFSSATGARPQRVKGGCRQHVACSSDVPTRPDLDETRILLVQGVMAGLDADALAEWAGSIPVRHIMYHRGIFQTAVGAQPEGVEGGIQRYRLYRTLIGGGPEFCDIGA